MDNVNEGNGLSLLRYVIQVALCTCLLGLNVYTATAPRRDWNNTMIQRQLPCCWHGLGGFFLSIGIVKGEKARFLRINEGFELVIQHVHEGKTNGNTLMLNLYQDDRFHSQRSCLTTSGTCFNPTMPRIPT